MKIIEWETEFNKLSLPNQTRVVKALTVLNDWPEFRREYKEFGIRELETIFSTILSNNKRKALREIAKKFEEVY